MLRRGPDGSNNVRMLAMVLTLRLAGCISESDELDPVNDQGERVSGATSSLNGFWSSPAGSSSNVRALIYNGIVYAFDDSNGYYGSTDLLSDGTTPTELFAYALNTASGIGPEVVADGAPSDYLWDVLLSGDNDVLFGPYSVNGVSQGNVRLEKDDTWGNQAPLRLLTSAGEWTNSSYALRFTSPAPKSELVTFKAVAEPDSGCSFSGSLDLENGGRNNLYKVAISKRENCPAFNEPASGYAGFNADGDLEFYLGSTDTTSLLFFTFTPPAGTTQPPATEPPTDGEGDETQTEEPNPDAEV